MSVVVLAVLLALAMTISISSGFIIRVSISIDDGKMAVASQR